MKPICLLAALGLLASCGGQAEASSSPGPAGFSLTLRINGEGTVECYCDGTAVTEDSFSDLLEPGDTLTVRATASEGHSLSSATWNGDSVTFSNGVANLVTADAENALAVTFAEVETSASDFAFSVADGGATVTSYSCSSTVLPSPVVIPDTVEIQGTEYPVTGVAARAFYNSGVRRIRLGANVEDLDPLAFSDVNSLYWFEVDGSNVSFKAIGGIIYSGEILVRVPEAYPSSSVEIEEGTTTIASYGFANTGVSEVIFPEGLTEIGDYAFSYATSLTAPDFPESLSNIGEYAFQYGNALGALGLNEGLERLGYAAFYQAGLTSVSLPSTLEAIPDYCFYFNRSLRSVSFSEGLKSIGQAAFSSASLTSVSFPDSLETIGQGAFEICTSLTEVELNEGLKSLGDYVFDRSTQITGIALPSTLESIGTNPFAGLTRLGYGGNFTLADGNENFEMVDSILFYTGETGSRYLSVYPMGKTESSYAIPEGTTHLSPASFVYQRSVTEVTLPTSLASIDRAFISMYTDVSGEAPELTLYYLGTCADFAKIDQHEENGSFYEGTSVSESVVHCTDGDYAV